MRLRAPLSSFAWIGCVVFLLLGGGCATIQPDVAAPPSTPGLEPGEATPPQVETPPITRLAPVQPDMEALEALEESLGGPVRIRYSTRDGEPFSVVFPIRQATEMSPEEVLEKYVRPALKGAGLGRAAEKLAVPNAPVRMPRPDFGGLADAVAEEYRRQPESLRPRTREMLAVFQGESQPTDAVDRALQMGEGMTFQQFKAEIERQEIQYPFQQVVGEVPIEHALALAVRREGESVSSLRGVLFADHAIANGEGRRLTEQRAVAAGFKALSGMDDVRLEEYRQEIAEASLDLLPYGSDPSGRIVLRYAWRMILPAQYFGVDGEFLLWVDAVDGRVLKLVSLLADAGARGEVYNRDPGVGTPTTSFEVDPSSGGQYTLQLSGVSQRVDYRGNGFDGLDVSIDDSTNGSSGTFANFDQAPLNDEAEVLCGSGTNKGFQQVNFFATIHRYWRRALSLGVFTPFPTSPWNPRVEMRQCEGADTSMEHNNGHLCGVDGDCCVDGNCGTCTAPHCNAWSSMAYGACGGYYAGDCPDSGWLNFSHDNTVIGHELAHNLTSRFTCARPADWCGMGGCSTPVCWWRLHDLADFWADHLESINCTAGWVAKNNGGTDASLYCATHTEGGGLPRLHEVSTPFDATSPGDHFPEHRTVRGGYADGQIGAAALWQVRLGMRSKCRPSGMPQFAVRFARALKNTGFFGATPPSTDRGIYRFLVGLETEMVEQWATSGDPGGPPAFRHNGRHTTNKLTSGFARAGIFLVPPECIDGDGATSDLGFCPGGDTGGDAVIDIDDNDLGDDLSIHGVDHPETDFLELGGPAPTFHVWTGPRYRFDASGCVGGDDDGDACTDNTDCAGGGVCQAAERATSTSQPLCNRQFRVHVSTSETFVPAETETSPWQPVNSDPTDDDVDCYGTWTPNPAQWTTLQAGGALVRIYYRAETRNPGGGNLRDSTEPGNGLYAVTPPYAVLSADGQSDY